MSDLIIEVDLQQSDGGGGMAVATSFALETKVNLDFLARLNARVREFYVDQGFAIANENGEADRETIELLYDNVVGQFFEVDDVERGSCKCKCKGKRGPMAMFFALCLFVGGAVGEPIVEKSEAGQFVIQHGVEYANVATKEVVRFAHEVADEVSDRVIVSTDGGFPYVRIVPPDSN